MLKSTTPAQQLGDDKLGHVYPVQSPAQLGAYLKSLRKSKGLTQASVAQTLGLSIARVSTMERNPGGLSVARLLSLLHVLGARLQLDVLPHHATHPAGEW